MENQNIECASINGNACPDGVSRLLVLDREDINKSYFCSGFMVAKNILVTNHHCVSTVTECNNTSIAVYDGFNYHQTKCKRIIKAIEDYPNANDSRRAVDFAVLEVTDDFNGTTFNISANRATAGDNVTAWVVDHTGLDYETDPNFLDSRITELKCHVQNQDYSASLILEDCPVIEGNSGSPAVNTSGGVVGVIWGANESDLTTQTDLDVRRDGYGIGIVTESFRYTEYTKI